MLRSWMSQSSLEPSRADAMACARGTTVPLLAIEHGADDAAPQPGVRIMFDASGDQEHPAVRHLSELIDGRRGSTA